MARLAVAHLLVERIVWISVRHDGELKVWSSLYIAKPCCPRRESNPRPSRYLPDSLFNPIKLNRFYAFLSSSLLVSSILIGHPQVRKTLPFKPRLREKSFFVKMDFICMRITNLFQLINGFALLARFQTEGWGQLGNGLLPQKLFITVVTIALHWFNSMMLMKSEFCVILVTSETSHKTTCYISMLWPYMYKNAQRH